MPFSIKQCMVNQYKSPGGKYNEIVGSGLNISCNKQVTICNFPVSTKIKFAKCFVTNNILNTSLGV